MSATTQALNTTVAADRELRQYELCESDWEKIKEVINVLHVGFHTFYS